MGLSGCNFSVNWRASVYSYEREIYLSSENKHWYICPLYKLSLFVLFVLFIWFWIKLSFGDNAEHFGVENFKSFAQFVEKRNILESVVILIV